MIIIKRTLALCLLSLATLSLVACGSEDKERETVSNNVEKKDDNKEESNSDKTNVSGNDILPYNESQVITEGDLYDAMIDFRNGDLDRIYSLRYNPSGIEGDRDYFGKSMKEGYGIEMQRIYKYSHDVYDTVVLKTDTNLKMLILENNAIVDEFSIKLTEDDKLILGLTLAANAVLILPVKVDAYLNGDKVESEPYRAFGGYHYPIPYLQAGFYEITFGESILELPEGEKLKFDIQYKVVGLDNSWKARLSEKTLSEVASVNESFFSSAMAAVNNASDRTSGLEVDNNTLSEEQRITFMNGLYESLIENEYKPEKHSNYRFNKVGNFIFGDKNYLRLISDNEFRLTQTVLVDYSSDTGNELDKRVSFQINYKEDDSGNLKISEVVCR